MYYQIKQGETPFLASSLGQHLPSVCLSLNMCKHVEKSGASLQWWLLPGCGGKCSLLDVPLRSLQGSARAVSQRLS